MFTSLQAIEEPGNDGRLKGHDGLAAGDSGASSDIDDASINSRDQSCTELSDDSVSENDWEGLRDEVLSDESGSEDDRGGPNFSVSSLQ